MDIILERHHSYPGISYDENDDPRSISKSQLWKLYEATLTLIDGLKLVNGDVYDGLENDSSCGIRLKYRKGKLVDNTELAERLLPLHYAYRQYDDKYYADILKVGYDLGKLLSRDDVDKYKYSVCVID